MVLGLAASLEEAQRPVSVACCFCDDLEEVRLADVKGAGTGHQNSARAKHFQGSEVELLVAAEGGVEVLAAFGEGRRVEDDGVVLLAGGRVVLEEVEGVGLD